jgi:hypothetical protein
MSISISRRELGEGGFALMMVLGFMVISFLIISGVLYSTSNAALQTDRHQRYFSAQEAATAAAEFAVAEILDQMHAGGRTAVFPATDPSMVEGLTSWAVDEDYDFRYSISGPATRPGLLWKYDALQELQLPNDVYTIRAGARTVNLDVPIASVVEQEIQVAEIPLFSYMAYSEYDLTFVTIAPNSITLDGRVHGNREIYCDPSGILEFTEHVTAAGEIQNRQHPADDAIRVAGTLNFQRAVDSHVNTMRLAPGLTNRYELLTQMANQADLFLVVSNDTVLVHDGFAAITSAVWTNFVTTNISFYDNRELRTVRATEFDVGGYRAQLGGGGAAKLIYMEDITSYGSDQLAGFRLVNGHDLGGALSVVSTNALYVRGNFNVNRAPAMLAADAVTLLSGAWDDLLVGVGAAENTTLNAAIVTGTVPSDASAGVFDGGYFNALRMIENWTGRTLTFRGAIATPFESRYADEPWRGEYYEPPTTRAFSYETHFLDPTLLPKGTPMLHTLIRGELVTLAPSALF